jgi:hypothetical protein
MTDQKPLPFIYQFAAGAVAGVSEVGISFLLSIGMADANAWRMADLGHVRHALFLWHVLPH